MIETVENVHQGRFARAVFAEERVDFALLQSQVNVIVREDAGKSLGDSVEYEDWRNLKPQRRKDESL
jgi:hypothetical protein